MKKLTVVFQNCFAEVTVR